MRSAAALSTHPLASHATGDVIADILDSGNEAPDLIMVFATSAFSGAAEDIARAVETILGPRHLLFVASSGVIGAGSEVSRGAALSMWAFWSETHDHDIEFISLDNGVQDLDYLSTRLLASAESVIVLGDPSLPMVTQTIDQLCELRTNKVIAGGLLSGSHGAPLLYEASGRRHGCIAITFRSTAAQASLAFGSTPLLGPLTVTRSTGSMVCELDGDLALDVVQYALLNLDETERRDAARRMAIAVHDSDSGAVVDVHEVLGADRESGALAVAATLPQSTIVSIHHLDTAGAASGMGESLGGSRSGGALLFACSTIDPVAEFEGVSDLGLVTESLGTAAYAGVHVATVVGTGSNGPGLSAAPLSAVIFGRRHH
jgi:hypothetical protein